MLRALTLVEKRAACLTAGAGGPIMRPDRKTTRMHRPLITDLNEIRARAAARQDAFEAMAEAIDFDDTLPDAALDALVEDIAAPIAAAIDCTQCGNCCRSLDVCLVPSDLEPLSQALHIPISEVRARYVDEPAGRAQGEWALLPAHPCPLLRGNLCSIYAHRPHACRVYPQFTPDFRYNLDDTIEGAASCPIIYNVLEALVERFTPQPDDGG